MHFDEDDTWRIGSDFDTFSVALHEAGHGLGLAHSANPAAVMYPFYTGAVTGLHQDDIDGIRSIYASTTSATVTVAATDASSAEPADPGTLTFTRTGNIGVALTVNFTVEGAATSGADYTSIGTTVTFAAGSATATKTVSVLDDGEVEVDETVVVMLASGSGYTLGSPAAATVTIQDDEPAVVTVTATDETAGEPGTGQTTGRWKFSRIGSTAGALTVNYTVGGTATSGTDYTSIGTTVTFVPGSAMRNKTLTVVDDSEAEADETVVVTLASGSGYTVGSPASALVTIRDDDDATVTVTATDPVAGELGTGQGTGTLTFSRTGSMALALTVNYTVGGTATSGTDYASIGTTMTFEADSATATKTVSVLADSDVEGDETVEVTLASGSGYTVGNPASAMVTIRDDDAAVAVTAADPTAGEPETGQGTGTLMFSRTGSTAAALTVNYTVGGTATGGMDYTSMGASVIFAAGSATATKMVSVLDDSAAEATERVVVTLARGSGYTVGSPRSATVSIQDDEPPVVTVTATDATAGESGTSQSTGRFTFNRIGLTAGALIVNYTVSGTATSGMDYTSIGTSGTFAAGSATRNKTVSVLDDGAVEGDETVMVTLASGSGYTVGSPASATVTIQDNDLPAFTAMVQAASGSKPIGEISLAGSASDFRSGVNVVVKGASLGKPGIVFLLGLPLAKKYVIESSPDLMGWSPLSTNVMHDHVIDLYDPNVARSNQQFYRLMPVPDRAEK